jgi:isopropylmalate/homocitrate/citramalate synthase
VTAEDRGMKTIEIYDTTLRDGAQAEGIDFS